MTKEELNDLSEKYHLGTCSEQEKYAFESLYERFQENPYSSSPWSLQELDHIRVTLLHKIHAKINTKPQGRQIHLYRYLRIAASIAFIIMAGLTVHHIANRAKEQPDVIVEYTATENNLPVTLPDGSKVWLQGQSRLWVPQKFHEHVREVALEGEAYFDVTSDKTKPFHVKTGVIYTEVLGTQFNISAHPDQQQISISLIEGKVNVVESIDKIKALLPMQQLVYNRDTRHSTIQPFDALLVSGWKDNILVLKDEPLASAVLKIGKKYKKEIILMNDGLKTCKVNAKLKDETFESVLEMLHYSFNIEYKLIDQTVQLSGKGCL